MTKDTEIDLEQQAALVSVLLGRLADSGAEAVAHLETHISHIILADDLAYKLKKPLNLGFLDFSTLARRRFCCEEEIRLNSRLAPDLYLDVVPVSGGLATPTLGGEGDVIDYAVRMRRFEQTELLNEHLPDSRVIVEIARLVAAFHEQIPRVEQSQSYGDPQRVLLPMLENFAQIRAVGDERLQLQRLQPLEIWTRSQAERLAELLRQRKAQGHVRECHGDMHLANITRYQGKLQIFDGIEFNPDLRWIDTISEVAFLLMDLQHRGLELQAAQFLNDYLARNGDYRALPLLRFYQLYRAMVRAKVAAIRLGQADLDAHGQHQSERDYVSYLELAEAYCRPTMPALLLTHGLSGSGKSLFSGWLAERLPAIHLRSDVERKRLFADTGAESGTTGWAQGIYRPQATRATYDHMRELAEALLQAGFKVIVDATFLKRDQRQAFQALARDLGCACWILDFQAPESVLRERVEARLREGADPSEADLRVLERQIEGQQPLEGDELVQRIVVDSRRFPQEDLLERVLASVCSGRQGR